MFERFPQAFVWQMDCKDGQEVAGDQLCGYFGCVGESPVARTRVGCGEIPTDCRQPLKL